MNYPLPAIVIGFAGALITPLRNSRLGFAYAAMYYGRTDTTRAFFVNNDTYC